MAIESEKKQPAYREPPSDGSAGLYAALAVIAILIVGALLWWAGETGQPDVAVSPQTEYAVQTREIESQVTQEYGPGQAAPATPGGEVALTDEERELDLFLWLGEMPAEYDDFVLVAGQRLRKMEGALDKVGERAGDDAKKERAMALREEHESLSKQLDELRDNGEQQFDAMKGELETALEQLEEEIKQAYREFGTA